MDRLINELLHQSTIDPATITTVNRVSHETITANVASPLAIIIYELLQNSLAHAFTPESPANFIEIRMAIQYSADDPDYIELTLSDDGKGDNTGRASEISVDSGIQIVRALASELCASCDISITNGYTTRLKVPLGRPPDQD